MRCDPSAADFDAIATVDEQLFYLYDELWANGDAASASVVQEMMDGLTALGSTNGAASGTDLPEEGGEPTAASG